MCCKENRKRRGAQRWAGGISILFRGGVVRWRIMVGKSTEPDLPLVAPLLGIY